MQTDEPEIESWLKITIQADLLYEFNNTHF